MTKRVNSRSRQRDSVRNAVLRKWEINHHCCVNNHHCCVNNHHCISITSTGTSITSTADYTLTPVLSSTRLSSISGFLAFCPSVPYSRVCTRWYRQCTRWCTGWGGTRGNGGVRGRAYGVGYPWYGSGYGYPSTGTPIPHCNATGTPIPHCNATGTPLYRLFHYWDTTVPAIPLLGHPLPHCTATGTPVTPLYCHWDTHPGTSPWIHPPGYIPVETPSLATIPGLSLWRFRRSGKSVS